MTVYNCIDHFVKVNFMATYEKIHFSVVSAFFINRRYSMRGPFFWFWFWFSKLFSGLFDFLVESVNKTVDAIVSELQQFERYLHGALRARVQTIFAMIRQCSTQQLTNLLRTCPPATTLHATRRLDTTVANTIFRITDSNQYLPLEHSVPMKAVFNQSFIPM